MATEHCYILDKLLTANTVITYIFILDWSINLFYCYFSQVMDNNKRDTHLSDTRMVQQQDTYEEIEKLKQRVVELEKG